MAKPVTRISDADLTTIDSGQYDIVGAIARDQSLGYDPEDSLSGTYVEVKPDRRMPPFVHADHPGTDMTPSLLLIEVDDPDDHATIQRLKERLGVCTKTA